jgi:GT2 family glycosyltransferase
LADRPLVSIVTPTLNQAPFLERTLASVRAQRYPNLEHIVIDGGSTDGTLDILRREAELGRLQFVSQADSGMYDAINKGLARTTGSILTYLNSDDAWFPWAVETIVAAFANRPDADLVFGDGIKVTEPGGSQRLRIFEPFDRVSLSNYESICQPAVFWRRRLYESLGGFDASMRYVADLDYWLRAAGAGGTIVHVSEVIAIERVHAARLSTAHEAAMASEARAMRAKHAGDAGGPEGRLRAVERDRRWQRWLWLRFMLAVALWPLVRSWPRFIREAGVSVSGRRILRAVRQYRYMWLVDAVSSSLAAEILGTETKPRSRRAPSVRKRFVHRIRLLAAALPFLPMARIGITGTALRRLAERP